MSIQNQEDTAAIAQLEEMLARQKAAFLREPNPSLAVRRERLAALAGMAMT